MVLKFPLRRILQLSKEKLNILNIKKDTDIFISINNKNKRLININAFSLSNKQEADNNDLKFGKIKKEANEKLKTENLSSQIKVNFDDIKTENASANKNKEFLDKSKASLDKNSFKNTKNEMNFDKSKTIKASPIQENSDLVLIYSQQTGMKYYIYNALFLSGYVVYFWLNVFKDIPEPLYSTILIFGSLSHILVIGLFMLSNRQIRNIYMKRNSNFLILETFSLLNIKKKSYLIDTSKIKEVRTNPLMKKMNLFYITYKDKFGFFKVLDYFVFRPTSNTSQMFDNIFKSKLKK
jgi:hypothetical protein